MMSGRNRINATSLGLLALTTAAGIIRRVLFGVVLMVVFAIVLAILFTFQLLHAALNALSLGGPLFWILRGMLR